MGLRHGTFGIVEIDEDSTWFLPADLDARTDDELMAAFRLTYAPPGLVVDGGYGMRALADVRERLAEILIPRGVVAREPDGLFKELPLPPLDAAVTTT